MPTAIKSRKGTTQSTRATTTQGPRQINQKRNTAGTAKRTHTWRSSASIKTQREKKRKTPVICALTAIVPNWQRSTTQEKRKRQRYLPITDARTSDCYAVQRGGEHPSSERLVYTHNYGLRLRRRNQPGQPTLRPRYGMDSGRKHTPTNKHSLGQWQ